MVARWAHNPKAGGSSPPPATKGDWQKTPVSIRLYPPYIQLFLFLFHSLSYSPPYFHPYFHPAATLRHQPHPLHTSNTHTNSLLQSSPINSASSSRPAAAITFSPHDPAAINHSPPHSAIPTDPPPHSPTPRLGHRNHTPLTPAPTHTSHTASPAPSHTNRRASLPTRLRRITPNILTDNILQSHPTDARQPHRHISSTPAHPAAAHPRLRAH